MQIGEVIRKYRRSKNMTQEVMANRLGVSAPAVNKWENGNSMPDIMLLAPIARLLDISLDTLLSFREELTREEINNLVNELNECLKTEPYKEVFLKAKKLMEQYPNCEWLIWQLAVVLDAWRITGKVTDADAYDEDICDCYIRILDSKEEDLRKRAADSLCGFYVRKEQWEKAEEYLEYFAKEDPERKRKQAYIYSKTGRTIEAYKAYEEILFFSYQMNSMVLHNLYLLAIEEGNRQKGCYYVEKEKQLAALFEMGKYQEVSAGLEMAVEEKNIDETIEIIKQVLESVDTIGGWRTSVLFEHMEFKPISDEFVQSLQRTLLDHFKNDETLDFLKEDKRYQELISFEV